MICLVHVHTYIAKHKFEIIPLISIQKGLAFKFFFLKAKFTKEHL